MTTEKQTEKAPEKKPGTALMKPDDQKGAVIWQALKQRAADIEKVLPKEITADRLLRVAYSQCRRNPELLEVAANAPETLIGALMRAAQRGLEPDGKKAYLVPRYNRHTQRKEVEYQEGYMGLLELAYKSGLVADINVRLVFTGDKFKFYSTETKDNMFHMPMGEDDPKKITHAWARAKMKGGGNVLVVLPRRKIDQAMEQSAAKGGPWKSHYDEMAKKTALLRLYKQIPNSPEMNLALIRHDIPHEDGGGASIAAGESKLDVAARQLGAPALQPTADDLPPYNPDTGEVFDGELAPPREPGADG